jgi:uncharacterized protein YndB with AHSA1/START domain
MTHPEISGPIEPIRCSLTVDLPSERAFTFFTGNLSLWWPREYTWGRAVVVELGIEPRAGGLCFERGPHGFRCDWGRVLAWQPPRLLTFAWQISPRREPEPDPAKASTIEVTFRADTPARTTVMLEHRDFERHGDGAAAYRAAMASPQGWPWILDRYAATAAPRSD